MWPGTLNLDLESTFGSIKIELNEESTATFDLRASFGTIDVPGVKGHLVERHSNASFTGQLGEGDGVVKAVASNGSVIIRGAPSNR